MTNRPPHFIENITSLKGGGGASNGRVASFVLAPGVRRWLLQGWRGGIRTYNICGNAMSVCWLLAEWPSVFVLLEDC